MCQTEYLQLEEGIVATRCFFVNTLMVIVEIGRFEAKNPVFAKVAVAQCHILSKNKRNLNTKISNYLLNLFPICGIFTASVKQL